MSNKKRKTSKRRSIFRKGKRKAFLRFLLWLILLIVVCGCIYLFVLQGDIPLPKAKPTDSPLTTAQPVTATETPAPEDNPADVLPGITEPPTAPVQETAAPEPTDTAEPRETAVPQEMLARIYSIMPEADDALDGLRDAGDQGLKVSLISLTNEEIDGRLYLVVKGHVYIEDRDAATSAIYVLLINTWDDSIAAIYQAVKTPEIANMDFSSANGANLDQGFFTAMIDVTDLPVAAGLVQGRVQIGVVNGDVARKAAPDERSFHFIIDDGHFVSLK